MYKFVGNNDFGSLSTGTLRPEDLIPCFVDEIERLRILNNEPEIPEIEEIKEKIRKDSLNDDEDTNTTQESYFESEEASIDLDEYLFYQLDSYAPPFCYFGANKGDGADFGFWVADDYIMDHFFYDDPTNFEKLDRFKMPKAGEYIDLDNEYCLTVNDYGEFVKMEKIIVVNLDPPQETFVNGEMVLVVKSSIKETIWENC
jgi:hypothetical protein